MISFIYLYLFIRLFCEFSSKFDRFQIKKIRVLLKCFDIYRYKIFGAKLES